MERVSNKCVMKMLENCANGDPCLIIDQDGDKVHTYLAPGFAYDNLLNCLKVLAKKDKNFRDNLCNYVIELSKMV